MRASQQFHPQTSRYTPEEMITQSEQRSNPHEHVIDPSLTNPTNGGRAMTVDYAYSVSHGDTRPLMNREYSFDAKQGHFALNFNDEQTQDDTGPGETKKKKGSASSIANDQELRKLFRENGHRDLKDVASEVLVHERGPRSEKTKQIFAMNW
jgi:regulatory factor X